MRKHGLRAEEIHLQFCERVRNRARKRKISIEALAGFIAAAKAAGLNVGVAGSLRGAHVPLLLPLRLDLIGFRGALCRNGAREAGLDPDACASIRALIPQVEAGAKPELAA